MKRQIAYEIAERYSGIQEVPGTTANPAIMSMLKLDNEWPEDDSVPWCSAFVNYICWLVGLPRSKSLRARSWLQVGQPVELFDARKGDIVILKRGKGEQPGPEVIEAPGHVGFYSANDLTTVWLLGGNQSDTVKLSPYPTNRVLGVRSLEV